MNSQIFKTAIVVLGFSAAGVLFYRWFTMPPEGQHDVSQLTYWVCANPECRVDFEMPIADVLKLKKKRPGPVPCPECDKQLSKRAHTCVSCGANNQSVGHGDPPEKCSTCGESMAP